MRVLSSLLLSWGLNALTLAIVGWTFTTVDTGNFRQLLAAAAIFGVLNTILKLLTLPLAVITLGIIWFFVAMLMLAITSWIVPGFEIHGFWALVWATVAVWIVNVILEALLALSGHRHARA
jgi:putative membrane protein